MPHNSYRVRHHKLAYDKLVATASDGFVATRCPDHAAIAGWAASFRRRMDPVKCGSVISVSASVCERPVETWSTDPEMAIGFPLEVALPVVQEASEEEEVDALRASNAQYVGDEAALSNGTGASGPLSVPVTPPYLSKVRVTWC